MMVWSDEFRYEYSLPRAVQVCLARARIGAAHFHVIRHVSKAVNRLIDRCAKKETGEKALDGNGICSSCTIWKIFPPRKNRHG